MTIATGDTAKLLIGAAAVLAGLTNMWSALRDGYIPYVSNGINRGERPMLFWGMIGVYIAVMIIGASFIVGGIAHVHTPPFD